MAKYAGKIIFPLSLVVALFILVGYARILAGGVFHLEPELLNRAEQKYGKSAREHLEAWENLITSDTSRSDLEKLEKVNNFFNQIEYREDTSQWGQKDYWATPVEFLASGGGDCEDYTIAKYFTLKTMGVDEDKLNLTYVKALRYDVHHMVLTYYSSQGSEPLILDNIDKEIRPASQRRDLLPIYSFNGTGLWLAKERGKGKFTGSSKRLQLWQELMMRMSGDNL